MEETIIEAKLREVVGKQVKALRRQGLLPAIIYGHYIKPIIITLDFHSASRILPTISSTRLVTIKVNGEAHTTLVREKQRHPITGSLLHVDFLEVSMTETLRTSVRLVFVGESYAVKNLNGILVTGQEEVEIEALPRDLPEKIVVDISVLKQIGDGIYVRDLPLPPNVTILANPGEMIVVVTAPAVEPEAAVEVLPTVATTEPEVIERGKKEEESF